MPKKNILVVGGAGFIGSQVVKMLAAANYHPIILDNLSTGNRKSIVAGTFIEGDIAHAKQLDELFDNHKIAVVLHFAALTDVRESVMNPIKYYQNNVVNTILLLNSMIRHGVKKFIFSSSAAIYGCPETDFISEEYPKNPINPYGKTKLMIEEILPDYEVAYGLKFCCLRYFNAAGGDPEGEIKNFKTIDTNLIPIVLKSIHSNSVVTINGSDYPTRDGTCVRDYIHIYDLGDAHIKAMEKLLNDEDSTYYNLGNGEGFSILEVINSVQEITGTKVNTLMGPRRLGDPPILLADATRAKKELGWKPKYPDLKTIITHAWKATK